MTPIITTNNCTSRCDNAVRHPCAGGYWGNSTGLTQETCDGQCDPGFFCPPGSVSPTQKKCGSTEVHCPRGSYKPTQTQAGYYSTREGHYVVDIHGDLDLIMDTEVMCEKGFYCRDGIRMQCPPGTYGAIQGASNETLHCQLCSPGYFCPGEANEPVVNSTHKVCGDPKFFCPVGSHYPNHVPLGYYSVNSEYIVQCEPGNWCNNGVKHVCSEGSYGSEFGLYTSQCSDKCPAGSFCSAGTINPIQCPPNTYSVAGMDYCISCGPNESLLLNPEMRCRTSRKCCQYLVK